MRPTTTYYLIAGLFTLSAALIWGVNTLFLLDAGLDIFGVFLANAAFTAGMVVFEVPTGVFADTVGRRASFLASAATLAVTTVGYIACARIGGGVLAFAAVSVVMGLGFTFYSGAVEAWLVDALRHSEYEGGLDGLSRAQSIELGYVAGGAAMVLAIPLLWAVRHIGGAPDVIVGQRAGVAAPCAAQGIPEVAGVDATARGAAVSTGAARSGG